MRGRRYDFIEYIFLVKPKSDNKFILNYFLEFKGVYDDKED